MKVEREELLLEILQMRRREEEHLQELKKAIVDRSTQDEGHKTWDRHHHHLQGVDPTSPGLSSLHDHHHAKSNTRGRRRADLKCVSSNQDVDNVQ